MYGGSERTRPVQTFDLDASWSSTYPAHLLTRVISQITYLNSVVMPDEEEESDGSEDGDEDGASGESSGADESGSEGD